MLLVLIQSSMYSAAKHDDWMQIGHGAGGELEVTQVEPSTHDQATSTVSDQPKGPEEFQPGFCAVVARLLEEGFAFLKDQAYGNPPFTSDKTTDAKNK